MLTFLSWRKHDKTVSYMFTNDLIINIASLHAVSFYRHKYPFYGSTKASL